MTPFWHWRRRTSAVDHPVIAVAHGACLEQRRIRACMRFGHRVAGEQLTVEQRTQIFFFLRFGAVVGDDLSVAGVGRLTAEHDRSPLRAAQNLVQQREPELAVALPRPARAPNAWPTNPYGAPLLSADRSPCDACHPAARTADVETPDQAARAPRERTRPPSPEPSGTRGRSRNPTTSRGSSQLNVPTTLSAAPGVEAAFNACTTSSKGIVWLTITAYSSQLAISSLVTSKISSG